jgi:hypothetical protein
LWPLHLSRPAQRHLGAAGTDHNYGHFKSMIHRNLQKSANKSTSIDLRTHHLRIGDTTYGRIEAQQKRDAKQAYQKMSCAEKSPSE